MPEPLIDPLLLAERRGRFLHQLGGVAAVIPAAPLVTHPYGYGEAPQPQAVGASSP